MQPLSEDALDDMVTRERDRAAPPLTDWDSLAPRLRAEGLIRDPVMSRLASRGWMRIAAGLALAVGGAAVGRVTASTSSASTSSASTLPANTSPANTSPANTSPASASNASMGAAPFASSEEAWEVLNRAGEEYQRASAYLSERNAEIPMPTPDQYRTRLAALDNVMTEMRSALSEAPQDPVINQYYLATVGAREATLRQLGTTLPASARLNRF